MKQFFDEMWKAISDFKFYREVKDFSAGKSTKYILSVVLLISLVLTVRYSYGMGKGLNIAVEWMKKNLPVIEIKDGAAVVSAEQPYEILQDDFAVILDTTGKTTSLDGRKKGILLMKDKIVYKENESKTEIYSLADIKALRIDENFMNAIRKNAIWIIFPFLLLGIYLYMAIARFIQILLFSLITIFASAVTKVKLTYSQIFNIGAYAITASMLFGAVAALFLKVIPGAGWVYCGMYIVYLATGVLNCKEAQ
ncbi:MAG: DUF1189 domain-containing protein [Candidatus Omnitrophica bacterium]|nr:DUF1189 domain-containing protein [Candidatus Omnitrophota bacterium]